MEKISAQFFTGDAAFAARRAIFRVAQCGLDGEAYVAAGCHDVCEHGAAVLDDDGLVVERLDVRKRFDQHVRFFDHLFHHRDLCLLFLDIDVQVR